MPSPLFVGFSDRRVELLPKYANRHGLIAGATGTGKTVTLQILAEQFSAMGVPVFMADVKGDLTGLAQAGGGNPKLEARAQQIGLNPYTYAASPTIHWDVFGEKGHRLRATISEMGPLLLSRLMGLSEAQEGALNIAFKVADDQGLLLLDLKDLRAMLANISEHAAELNKNYGLVSSQSIGAIQRSLLVLEQQGAEEFFAEPALALSDIMRTTTDGRGYISILAADKLMQNPRLYSTFLLWLLSELFEVLPEVGDLEQPKLVFFFDEAHLLFNDAPKPLIEKVEQVVRLIRSKGVGIYFVTQNPLDIPDTVLGQLGNRVQHALRAFTPRDQKAVQSAADTFRPNPAFKTDEVITQMGVGEALVSTLDEKGIPIEVQRTLIKPPASHLGPAEPAVLTSVRALSPVAAQYDKSLDRESAYEILEKRTEAAHVTPPPVAVPTANPTTAPTYDYGSTRPRPQHGSAPQPERREKVYRREPSRRSDTIVEAAVKSATRSAASSLGRQVTNQLVRGVLGSLFRR
jgi:DNA helicase HerA-like ATPase